MTLINVEDDCVYNLTSIPTDKNFYIYNGQAVKDHCCYSLATVKNINITTAPVKTRSATAVKKLQRLQMKKL